jgi:hypothetical protein
MWLLWVEDLIIIEKDCNLFSSLPLISFSQQSDATNYFLLCVIFFLFNWGMCIRGGASIFFTRKGIWIAVATHGHSTSVHSNWLVSIQHCSWIECAELYRSFPQTLEDINPEFWSAWIDCAWCDNCRFRINLILCYPYEPSDVTSKSPYLLFILLFVTCEL